MKNQKYICSQRVIQKGLVALSNFPRYVPELVRRDLSSSLGVSLANALLLDLKAFGLLIPSININDIIIDKCKVDRAKTKVKTTAQQKYDQSMENLICIAVDGRMDKDTLLYKEICGGKWTENNEKTRGPEHHLTFIKETPYESKYLAHRVLPNIGATGAIHAEQVVNVLYEFKNESTIKAILVDNTNANTGCECGIVAILEKKF